MELPEALLDLPADESARLIVLRLLDDVVVARLRLSHPDDVEALHDFRVALRRLRSALRAWRLQLGPAVSKRIRRRLRDIARATGRSRDLEVHIGWVKSRMGGLRDYQRAGAEWLLARLEARKVRADRRLERRLARDFARTEARLRTALPSFRVTVVPPFSVPSGATGGAALGRLVSELSAGLASQLALVLSIGDQVEAHRARIAGKRLRYVLEPVAQRIDQAPGLIARLKELQDVLGALHDAHVFAGDLARALQLAALQQARRVSRELMAWAEPEATVRDPEPGEDDPRLGLVALAHRLRVEAEAAFADLRSAWLDGGGAAAVADAEALAHRLVASESAAAVAD
ncbi:MAG TPA: CHAD domain-containing protein [Gemmatimonadales bacterium]|jgi:CHAD domain-containing protein|nr:CHAD domain-containing protein [Gemmatimonadales bacterium]